MEIILLEKVRNLGNLGDKVNVKPGFGRNYLIPNGKAVMATKQNVAAFEARRAELEQKAAAEVGAAQVRAEQLAALEAVTIGGHAGDEGRLFGSIGPADIADALSKAGVEVEKREVKMPEGPIRQIGEYKIDIQVHADVVQPVTIQVVAE